MRMIMIGDIYGNNIPLYYPDDKEYVSYGTDWNQKVGLCGEFTFNVPKSNPKYQDIEEFKVITLLKDGKEEWRGFIKSFSENSDKESMNVYCLEDLAWLKDVPVAPVQQSVDRATKLQSVVAAYNAMTGISGTVKTFEAGYVITGGNGKWEAGYDTSTLDALRGLAGDNQYVRVRRAYDNNNTLHRYIDFVTLGSFGINSRQKIEFGENLQDFVKEFNTSWMLNVINPYGAEIEGDEVYEGCTRRIAGTSLSDSASITHYGRIEKNIIFDTSDTATLNTQAADYLNQNKDPRLTLELKAVDLSQAGYDTDSLNLGDKVRVIAEPYGIDQYVYITELNIDIQDLARNVITLSSTVPGPRTMTEQQAEINKEIEKKIPDLFSILSAAQANAIAILDGSRGGYKYFVFNDDNQIIEEGFTDNLDTDQATVINRWNVNGNAILTRDTPSDPWTVEVAQTLDGHIVANRVTIGSLGADVMKANVVSAVNGQLLKIEAKNIDINGSVTFTDLSPGMQSYVQGKADAADLNDYASKESLRDGTTTINGNCVQTGTVKSNNYTEQSASSKFSTTGSKFDLSNGLIKSKNFRIDNNGGAFGNMEIGRKNIKLPDGSTQESAFIYTEGYVTFWDEEWKGQLSKSQKKIFYFSPYYDGWTDTAGADIDFIFSCDITSGSHISDYVCRARLYKWTGSAWSLQNDLKINYDGDDINGQNTWISGFYPSDKNIYKLLINITKKEWAENYYIQVENTGGNTLELAPDENIGSFRGHFSGSAELYSLSVGDLSVGPSGNIEYDDEDSVASYLLSGKNGLSINDGQNSGSYPGSTKIQTNPKPLIQLKKAGSSTECIKLETEEPELLIKDSSSEYIDINKEHIIAHESTNKYVELNSGTPAVQVYKASNDYIDITDTLLELKLDSSNNCKFKRTKLQATNGGSSYEIQWTSSDRRFKEEIEPLDMELSRMIIDATETKKFKYKNETGKHYGMIAQEAREVLDSLGEEDAMLEHSMDAENENAPDPRNITYTEYIPLLINYIKYLRAETDSLKDRLNTLEGGNHG